MPSKHFKNPMKRSNAAAFLLFAIGAAKAANTPPLDPTGTYALRHSEERVTIRSNGASPMSTHVPTGFAGVIRVMRIAQDRVLVDLKGNKGFPSFNQGSFTATLAYGNSMAIHMPLDDDPSCVITLKWSRHAVVVSQTSDDANTACGFGHAVAVDGVYRKISSKRPEIPAD